VRRLTAFAALPFLVVTVSANAQTDSVASKTLRTRIEAYAEGRLMIPTCERLGYQKSDAGARRTSQLVVAAAFEAGLKEGELDKAVDEASERAFHVLNNEMADAKTDEANLAWIERAAATCARMAQAPDGALVTAPAGYDRKAAVTLLMDQILESSGRAAWQTPQIVARGEFLYDVGLCGRVLDASQLRALAEPYLREPAAGDATAARAYAYYKRTYELGVRAAGWKGLSKKECIALKAPATEE
jgi:hypothetical protein